jgi:hypothetical protein
MRPQITRIKVESGQIAIDRNSHEFRFLRQFDSCLRQGPFLMRWYRERVGETAQAYPDFPSRLRALALVVLAEEDSMQLRRNAVQALAVVGLPEDIPAIEAAAQVAPDLATDIPTCLFEIHHRQQGEGRADAEGKG